MTLESLAAGVVNNILKSVAYFPENTGFLKVRIEKPAALANADAPGVEIVRQMVQVAPSRRRTGLTNWHRKHPHYQIFNSALPMSKKREIPMRSVTTPTA
jgi:hypothetical protein